MHLVNQGQLAAALILAGVSLPAEFNLEESVIARKEEELRGTYPKLDKVALDLLAQVATSKDLAAELNARKQEFEAELPAGADAATIALFKKAHGEKVAAVTAEIESLKQKDIIQQAHDAAEAATLRKHGLMRDDKGELVPFVETPEPDSGDAIADAVSDAPPVPVGTEPKAENKEPEPSDVTLGTGADAEPMAVEKTGKLVPEAEAKKEDSQDAPDHDKKPETIN